MKSLPVAKLFSYIFGGLGSLASICYLAALLPWESTFQAISMMALIVLLSFLWTQNGKGERGWGGFLIHYALVPSILISAVAYSVFYPFMHGKDQIYVMREQAGAFGSLISGNIITSRHAIDSNTDLVVANHQVHWYVAKLKAKWDKDRIEIVDPEEKMDWVVYRLPFLVKASNLSDLLGQNYSTYSLPIFAKQETAGFAHASIREDGTTKVTAEIASVPDLPPYEFDVLKNLESLAIEEVVFENSPSSSDLIYLVKLIRFFQAEESAEMDRELKALLELAPTNREKIRIYGIKLLRERHRWSGNILFVQSLPYLKGTDRLIRYMFANGSEPGKDRLLYWTSRVLFNTYSDYRSVFEEDRLYFESIVEKSKLDFEPVLIEENNSILNLLSTLLGPIEEAPPISYSDAFRRYNSSNLHLRSEQAKEIHFSQEDRMFKDFYRLGYGQEIPKRIPSLVWIDEKYAQIWWSALLDNWGTENFAEIFRQIFSSGDAFVDFESKLLIGLTKFRKDVVQLNQHLNILKDRWGDRFGDGNDGFGKWAMETFPAESLDFMDTRYEINEIEDFYDGELYKLLRLLPLNPELIDYGWSQFIGLPTEESFVNQVLNSPNSSKIKSVDDFEELIRFLEDPVINDTAKVLSEKVPDLQFYYDLIRSFDIDTLAPFIAQYIDHDQSDPMIWLKGVGSFLIAHPDLEFPFKPHHLDVRDELIQSMYIKLLLRSPEYRSLLAYLSMMIRIEANHGFSDFYEKWSTHNILVKHFYRDIKRFRELDTSSLERIGRSFLILETMNGLRSAPIYGDESGEPEKAQKILYAWAESLIMWNHNELEGLESYPYLAECLFYSIVLSTHFEGNLQGIDENLKYPLIVFEKIVGHSPFKYFDLLVPTIKESEGAL